MHYLVYVKILILIIINLPDIVFNNRFKQKDTHLNGNYSSKFISVVVLLIYLFDVLTIYQVFNNILPITLNRSVQIPIITIGIILIVVGLGIHIRARIDLKDSWSGLILYRIRKKQKLVTTGVYKVIRHPIYFATLLKYLGYQLVANSWLFLPITIILYYFINLHIENEEVLLKKYFDKRYYLYMQRVTKLIPIPRVKYD